MNNANLNGIPSFENILLNGTLEHIDSGSDDANYNLPREKTFSIKSREVEKRNNKETVNEKLTTK
jgi:hypothetical protein